MSPESTLLEADKSSGQMIWTNAVRLKGNGTKMYRYQPRKEIDNQLIMAGCAVQDREKDFDPLSL